ncbi:hypothetical protein [Mycolicibacterium thermoresistibile]
MSKRSIRRELPVSNYLKKAAIVGGAAATATVMTVTMAAPANAATVVAAAKESSVSGEAVNLTAASTDGLLARMSPTEILRLGALVDNLGSGDPVSDVVTLSLLDDLIGGLLPGGGDDGGDGNGSGLIGGLLPGLGDGLDELVGGLVPGVGDGLGDLLDGVVGDLLPGLLPDLDPGQLLPGVGDLIGNLLPTLGDLLGGALLGSLFGWGGLDLTGPLELLGVNVVTTGPPFGALALMGLNLGWVPALPSLIAHEVTSTRTVTDLDAVVELLDTLGLNLGGLLGPLLGNLTGGVRLPLVTGFGLGALSAGMAYPRIAEHFEDDNGLLTLMPYLLLNNWGRADGGIAARFAPLLDPLVRIFGYESVVTPDVANSGSLLGLPGGLDPLASFVPIKVDATWEYSPFADFAAWPNPVTLANNLAALAFPTYLLRGGDLPGFLADVLDLGSLVPELGPEGANNNFLTMETDRLPLLEPFRYPADIANLFTLGLANFSNPFADAVEPALKILTDLGYTNVVQNPDGSYDRNFEGDFGSERAPFLSFPEEVDWGQVPGDVFQALIQGFSESFLFGGIPGVNNPYLNGTREGITSGAYNTNLLNVVGQLLDAVGGLVGGLPGNVLPLSTDSTSSALDLATVGSGAGGDGALFRGSDPASLSASSTVVNVEVGAAETDGQSDDGASAEKASTGAGNATTRTAPASDEGAEKIADSDTTDARPSDRGSRLITGSTGTTDTVRSGGDNRRGAVSGNRGNRGVERSTISRPDRGSKGAQAGTARAGQRADGVSRAGGSGDTGGDTGGSSSTGAGSGADD